MQIHGPRSRNGEGLQPCHSTRDLRRRGRGRLFGLSINELANVIAIATVDNISLACVPAEPVFTMEGLLTRDHRDARCLRRFPGQARLHRSKRSLRSFEGPYGLEQMLAQSIPVDWEDPSLEVSSPS